MPDQTARHDGLRVARVHLWRDGKSSGCHWRVVPHGRSKPYVAFPTSPEALASMREVVAEQIMRNRRLSYAEAAEAVLRALGLTT